MTQVVTFKYRDSTGKYDVSAAVSNIGIVLLEIEDEYGTLCDIEDWNSAEQMTMKGLAKKALESYNCEDDDADIETETDMIDI
jgi:hypothetical protein